MRRLLAPLLVLLAAVVLTGCAGQRSNGSAKRYQGEAKAVAQVVDDLAQAGKKGDAKAICTSVFSTEVAAKLTQGTRDCQGVVQQQLKAANVFNLDVKAIKVTGSTATARVSSKFDGRDQLRRLSFRKQGLTWRLVSMSPAG